MTPLPGRVQSSVWAPTDRGNSHPPQEMLVPCPEDGIGEGRVSRRKRSAEKGHGTWVGALVGTQGASCHWDDPA